MKLPTIQDWIWVEAMFIQAMIGGISTNFRQVALSYENKTWVLTITLEKNDDTDQEEASDIVDEFSVYLEDIRDKISSAAYVKGHAVIEISSGRLEFEQEENIRVLFRRKEK